MCGILGVGGGGVGGGGGGGAGGPGASWIGTEARRWWQIRIYMLVMIETSAFHMYALSLVAKSSIVTRTEIPQQPPDTYAVPGPAATAAMAIFFSAIFFS